MKHILVAVDGSDHARRAVELAADIAQKYDARLILVHVLDDKPLSAEVSHLADVEFTDLVPEVVPEVPDTRLGERVGAFLQAQDARVSSVKKLLGERILADAADEARKHGARSIKTMLCSGDPATEILAACTDCEANLMVIGSRGRSELTSLLLGSVSHKVNNLSPVNVITVR